MRRIFWIIIVTVAATVALSLFAGEKHSCTAPPEECLKKMHAKLSATGWLGIETDKSDDGKILVAKVWDNSPAQAAGFSPGDMLLAINGVVLSDDANKEALKKVKSSLGPGSEVTYTVVRHGGKLTLNARLSTMPETLVAQYVGEHMIKEHLQTQVASK